MWLIAIENEGADPHNDIWYDSEWFLCKDIAELEWYKKRARQRGVRWGVEEGVTIEQMAERCNEEVKWNSHSK